MELTVWLNIGAHGHIHELLGGSWSKQATAFAEKKPDVLQIFAHQSTVSLERSEPFFRIWHLLPVDAEGRQTCISPAPPDSG